MLPTHASPDTRFGAMHPEVWTVAGSHPDTDDTFTFDLAPPAWRLGLPFAPGQFTMLYAFGIGEVPISISGDPERPERLIHTVRAVGGVTRALQRLRAGDPVGVRGPFGSAWPLAAAEGRDLLIVAGGIGLAPLRPALYRALARRDRFRRVVLLVGARTPDDLLYPGELAEWRSRFDLDVMVTVDRAAHAWRGDVGVVTRLLRRAPFDPRRATALVCGPEPMIRAAAQELERRGLRPDDIAVSLERHMQCGVGLCGHCQLGPHLLCRDGPVLGWDRAARLLAIPEV